MNKMAGLKKRAVIFDLDGTLVDSMPFVIAGFIYAVEPFRPHLSEAEVLTHLGGPLDTCLRNILGAAAADSFSAARKRLLDYEHGREQDLKPFAGAKELLAELRVRNVKLGIWTGRDRYSTEKIMAAHGLGPFFPAMVCGDDLPTHKPDPAGLLHAIKLAGVAPNEAIFVGDADADVMGGHAAGVHTIFIHHGRRAPAHIHSRAAEVFAYPREAYPALVGHFA